MPSAFLSRDVRQLTGLSQRQLTYWDESDLLRPHGRSGRGRGSRRLYSLLDVLQLMLVARLRQAGLSLQRVRKVVTYLADLPDEPAPLAELEVLTDGKRVIVRHSDNRLVDVEAQQYILRFPLSELLAKVANCTNSPEAETLDARSQAVLIGASSQ